MSGPAGAAARMLRSCGDAVAEVFWPTRCVGCDAMGDLLCARCRDLMYEIDQKTACPRCGAPFGSLVCTECSPCLSCDDDPWSEDGPDPGAAPSLLEVIADLDAHRSYAMLEWPHDRMVRAFKDAQERRLAGYLAAGMVKAARAGFGPEALARMDAVSFVPCTPQAFARRGADHMELVARDVARSLGLPLDDILARRSKLDQRGLGKGGRRANALGSFAVLHGLEGGHVLLLDDVFTTGATLGAAAYALKSRGAAEVLGLTFARAWLA